MAGRAAQAEGEEGGAQVTEPKLRDLTDAILALRDSLRRRAPRLAAIAARLREYDPPLGLDLEADELDAHALEMMLGIETIQRRCDGLLEETQPMSFAEVADEDG